MDGDCERWMLIQYSTGSVTKQFQNKVGRDTRFQKKMTETMMMTMVPLPVPVSFSFYPTEGGYYEHEGLFYIQSLQGDACLYPVFVPHPPLALSPPLTSPSISNYCGSNSPTSSMSPSPPSSPYRGSDADDDYMIADMTEGSNKRVHGTQGLTWVHTQKRRRHHSDRHEGREYGTEEKEGVNEQPQAQSDELVRSAEESMAASDNVDSFHGRYSPRSSATAICSEYFYGMFDLHSPVSVNVAARVILFVFVTDGHPGLHGSALEMWNMKSVYSVGSDASRVDIILLGVVLVELYAWRGMIRYAIEHLEKLIDHIMNAEDDSGADYARMCLVARSWQRQLMNMALVQTIQDLALQENKGERAFLIFRTRSSLGKICIITPVPLPRSLPTTPTTCS